MATDFWCLSCKPQQVSSLAGLVGEPAKAGDWSRSDSMEGYGFQLRNMVPLWVRWTMMDLWLFSSHVINMSNSSTLRMCNLQLAIQDLPKWIWLRGRVMYFVGLGLWAGVQRNSARKGLEVPGKGWFLQQTLTCRDKSNVHFSAAHSHSCSAAALINAVTQDPLAFAKVFFDMKEKRQQSLTFLICSNTAIWYER